ncbi:MAG: SH3 domain-containing protein, partial [Chloroflexi bacterium]|nr:SH3 domain-containing protein [Chloroflexota bacterium]
LPMNTPVPATLTVVPSQSDDEKQATAVLSSSLFSQPDSDTPELTFIGIGEVVIVLGQSDNGEWLYVQNDEEIAGFVHTPRLDWSGDLASLPVITAKSATAPPPTTDTVCGDQNCPPLSLDIYPLDGSWCANGRFYRTVFMMGQGGDGRYTYYWNEQKIGGPLTGEGFGFNVSSLDAAAVIGTGKVVSGDGQSAEKELFISNFTCD